MKNQAILVVLEGDFAMYLSPCMEVSAANAVRFSSSFILIGKEGTNKVTLLEKQNDYDYCTEFGKTL